MYGVVLVEETLSLVVAALSTLLTVILMACNTRRSPLVETKLIFIGTIFLFVDYTSYMVVPLISSPNDLATELRFFDALGYIAGQIGLLFLGLAFILTDFKSDYRNIFSIVVLTSLAMFTAAYNAFSYDISLVGSVIVTTYTPLGSVLIILFLLSFIFVFIRRLHQVYAILEKEKFSSPVTSYPSILVFSVLTSLSISFYIFTRIASPALVPTYLPYVGISLITLYFSIAVYFDPAFFFMTPTSLDSILIVENHSGSLIQSYSFKAGLTPEEIVSGVFSLLNISLKEMVQTESSLEEIRFGEKVLLIAPGRFVTTLMTVSDNNFVAKAVVSQCTKKFETIYREQLLKLSDKMIDSNSFAGFEEYVLKNIRPFIPL